MNESNKPDHQHFIPRSYLRNFAQSKKDKKFVEVADIVFKNISLASTKNICVKKGLYTLKDMQDEAYALEKYYAEHVDSIYPEVYNLLIDKNTTIISNRQKHKIINTILSLYFRTPKFLHAHNKFTAKAIDRLIDYYPDEEENIKINYLGQKLEFLRSETEEIKRKIFEQNREEFLLTHFDAWHQFVSFKYQSAISVFEIKGDIELITSDNPVDIHSGVQNSFYLFDPTNVIQIPLDRRHYLFIYPNTEKGQSNKIFREVRDKTFALVLNHSIHKNAEMWIIGYPNTVEKHIKDQKKYNEPNEENEKWVEDIKEKVTVMKNLVETIEKMESSVKLLPKK